DTGVVPATVATAPAGRHSAAPAAVFRIAGGPRHAGQYPAATGIHPANWSPPAAVHLFVHPADSADAPARGCGVTAFAGAAPASGCGPSRAAAHPVPDASLRASSASHRRHAYNRASALYAEADNALQWLPAAAAERHSTATPYPSQFPGADLQTPTPQH